jgi:hypothetical protein
MIQVMKWWLAAASMIGVVLVASARGSDAPAPRAAAASVADGAARAAVDVPDELQLAAVCDDTECQAFCWARGSCEGVCRSNACRCMFSRSRPCP